MHRQKPPMTMTNEQISEIAEMLECGMICFFHRPTGAIEYHADPDDPYFEEEMWEDIIDKIEDDLDNYDRFEKMDSHQGFRVMANFAHSLTDTKFRDRILDRLSRPKPFQNFKTLIDSSDYRQDWFDFKKQAYIDFVRQQIEMEKAADEEE